MNDKIETLGSKIKEIRESQDISQVELSKRSKIARTVITMIESDKRYPSEKTLNKIVDALGVTQDEIYTPEVREYSLTQLEKASEKFKQEASTDEIIKVYRKMISND